jgi:hypothetical protein
MLSYLFGHTFGCILYGDLDSRVYIKLVSFYVLTRFK